jgi:hypothetical protein
MEAPSLTCSPEDVAGIIPRRCVHFAQAVKTSGRSHLTLTRSATGNRLQHCSPPHMQTKQYSTGHSIWYACTHTLYMQVGQMYLEHKWVYNTFFPLLASNRLLF